MDNKSLGNYRIDFQSNGKIYNKFSVIDPLSKNSCLTFSDDEDLTLTISSDARYYGTLEYSTDSINWYNVTKGSAIQSINKKIYLRGMDNASFSGGVIDGVELPFFIINGRNTRCTGNIETLLNYVLASLGIHPRMVSSCYSALFKNCTSLVQAPELPATTLASWCYNAMFEGCTSLVQAPELPATTLADFCYFDMFHGCTSLTQVPTILPATRLTQDCYYNMFGDCTSLTTTPSLPATILANLCYDRMFKGCTSLTIAPALPATTLANYCYADMFEGCTSLTTAPELPATELAEGCYYYMFYDCKNLTQIPALPAATLSENCYKYMFVNCKSIKLSTTKTGEYINEYRIPYGTERGVTATDALFAMFNSTGGTVKGTPEINTTYYTSNVVI